MLDLAATATQVAERARELRTWDAAFPARRDRAVEALRSIPPEPLPPLPAPIARWIALSDAAPPDARVAGGAILAPVTIIAVDGSQIEPDFHELVSCCLINVGWARFHFGARTGAAAEMGSRPEVRLGDDALVEDVDGPDAPIPESRSRRVEVRRMLAEVHRLRELIEEVPEDGQVVALVDGPLVAYWVLNLLDDRARRHALDSYLQLFATARQRNVALAGYISRTRSAEVANRIRYHACSAVRAGGTPDLELGAPRSYPVRRHRCPVGYPPTT